MSQPEPINIVLASDRAGVMGLAVTVRSTLNHCSRPCNIIVISVGLTPQIHRKLEQSWQGPRTNRIEFVELDADKLKRFRSIPTLRSKVTYARLFLDRLCPDLKRALYLDIDLLVTDDVVTIYDTDLVDAIVGVMRHVSQDGPVQKRRARNLGLVIPQEHFNGGVMLIDVDKWRNHRVGERAVEVAIENYDLMHTVDQDALNVVLHQHWTQLPGRFNTSQYQVKDIEHKGIVHLIGGVKPWHVDYDYIYRDAFFEVLDQTAFAGYRPRRWGGLAVMLKRLGRRIPTWELLWGKLRREMGKRLGTPIRANGTLKVEDHSSEG